MPADGAPAGIGAEPSISVIVPVYNRAASIGEALATVLGQSRPPGEVIVVDDGSTDDLEAALAPFAGRVRLIRQANGGVARARNAGVAAARGSWLAFLDSDDLWTPRHLERTAAGLRGVAADVVAHLGDVLYVGPGYRQSLFAIKGRSFPQDRAERVDSPLDLVISGMTLQGAAIRRDAFLRLGGFDEEMRMLSDTAFFARLSLAGPFLITGEVLAEIRRLPDDDDSVTSLHRTQTLYARQMHVRLLAALDDSGMTPAQRRLRDAALSGAEFRLAETLARSSRREALGALARSARRHPSPLRGWGKAALAAALGLRGYRMILDRRPALDRS